MSKSLLVVGAILAISGIVFALVLFLPRGSAPRCPEGQRYVTTSKYTYGYHLLPTGKLGPGWYWKYDSHCQA